MLQNITFTVNTGEYFVLLGVSGAGKTMLLEIITGLQKQDKGHILLDGQDISSINTHKRNIGLVFQDNTLFPHLNVRRNMAYALAGKGFTQHEIYLRVEKWAGIMDIAGLLERKPAGLSGGEARRVTLARTLAMEPKMLLLDEPLSSLDVLLQFDMIRLLKKLRNAGQTILHVTHDYNEAYALADKLAVINGGKIEQYGPPADVFSKPASKFVSALAGIRNFFTCSGVKSHDKLFELIVNGTFHLFSANTCNLGSSIFIKEDDIKVMNAGNAAAVNVFNGTVTDIFPSPEYYSIVVDAGLIFFTRVSNAEMTEMNIHSSDRISLVIPPEAVRSV